MLETSSAPRRAARPATVHARRSGASTDAPASCVALIGPKGPMAVLDVSLAEGPGRSRLLVHECRRKACVDGVVLGTRTEPSRRDAAHGHGSPGDAPRTLVKAAGPGLAGEQVFVVNSAALLARERLIRQRCIDRTRAALDGLARRVAERGIDGPERIGKAAARILARNDGHRYFEWRRKGSAFVYFERSSPQDQRAFEGTYVIRVPEPGPSAPVFVSAVAFLLDRAFARARLGVALPVLAEAALEELARTDIVEDKAV